MWNDSTIWWLLAGVAVAAELATGTFYLLMLALGMAAGAIAAHLGAGMIGQMVAAAVVGSGAVVAWHIRRGRQPASPRAQANPDVVMDVGETVQVRQWRSDGLADLHYRGAQWSGALEAEGPRAPGPHRIVAVQGNRLILAPLAPAEPPAGTGAA